MKLPINYEESDWQVRRRARHQYVNDQAGLCCHCDFSLEEDTKKTKVPIDKSLFPRNFFDNPVHLHHCHTTGMTIGAVHAYCNAELWQYHGE